MPTSQTPPAPRPWPLAVLFDLDGTLVDSVPDITAATTELLAGEHLPAPSEQDVRSMVGNGTEALVARAFAAIGRPLQGEALTRMTARMMTIYPRHLVDKSVLMPGVMACLEGLAAHGCALGVVTNKPQDAAETVLAHFAILPRLSVLQGDQPLKSGRQLARKPAPDMLAFALDKLGVAPADAVMVGDSESDIRSAQAGGLIGIGVRGGYTNQPLETFAPDLVLDSLAGLVDALKTWRKRR